MKRYFVGPADTKVYPSEYFEVAVIENVYEEWVADFGWTGLLSLMNCEQVEAQVASILGLDPLNVVAYPVGPHVSGDASFRNLYVTSLNWLITVP